MTATPQPHLTIPRRAPAHVMRLARLGAFHQSRLSFMRVLIRRMRAESWTFARPEFAIDSNGVGHAVYTAQTPARCYSLVAFAHDLPAQLRSDRVIATAWDATFALFDGVPDAADIARLRANIPLQEAGRVTRTELSVSRANRSVRLWEHVVTRLAAGRQPDPDQIAAVGYLMRTTAVYGSGKLGAADRAMIAGRPECAAPFQIEMLSVFLTRAFVRDLVQHMAQQMARAQGRDRAATLDPALARSMGIGNSTGLGMAPFLINHPVLFNNWIAARETAIARVRSLPRATPAQVACFVDLLHRACISAQMWRTADGDQQAKLAVLRADLARLCAHVADADLLADHPWNRLFVWAQTTLGTEAQECLASLLMEPYGALVDGLADDMADQTDPAFRIDGSQTLADLGAVLTAQYDWALALDWTDPACSARAWYVSAEKLEPRLGERNHEPIAPYENPLAPGRDAAALAAALQDWPETETVAAFLLRHPHHRHMVRRA